MATTVKATMKYKWDCLDCDTPNTLHFTRESDVDGDSYVLHKFLCFACGYMHSLKDLDEIGIMMTKEVKEMK